MVSVAEVLRRVVDEEPPTVRSLVPNTPRDLALICEKCLAKAPHERYATAGELAEELRRFSAGEPVSVRSAGVVEKTAKWARRKPIHAAAWTLGTVATVLLAFGVTVLTLWLQAAKNRDHANVSRGEAELAKGDADRQREKFERFEYGRTMQVAHQEWREHNIVST